MLNQSLSLAYFAIFFLAYISGNKKASRKLEAFFYTAVA
jgi:hypothetical protein